MIVSHTHKFIFIHCRKVAGSSIKVTLAPHLGEEDIVIGSLNEIIASGSKPTKAMRTILRSPLCFARALNAKRKGMSWPNAQNASLKKYYEPFLGPNSPHPSASRAAAYLGPAWDSYFKFCFVRNPYERVVSDYFWRRKVTNRDFSFLKYLEILRSGVNENGILHKSGVSNWEMISIDGVPAFDFAGRYESLEEDFQTVTERLGFPEVELRVRMKAGESGGGREPPYGDLEKDIVSEIFREEIEHFGFSSPV